MENVTYGFVTAHDDNFTSMIVQNSTQSYDLGRSMPIFKVIFTFILCVIMFGMGCAVDHRALLDNLKRPIGIAIGLTCQIILMPVLTYALIKISGMKTIQAIAFMLVGCSPGGSNSNVITYFIKGDLSLSVAMTTFSNILALGTVPLNVLIFTAVEHIEGSLTIPYWSLAISLSAVGVPIVLGIIFRYKFPERTRYIPKICAGIAIVILIATIISMIVVTKMTFIFSLDTILPVAILPFVGMGASYLISSIPVFKLSKEAKKAIAVETLVQNAGLSNSVLILTYGSEITIVGEAITIPLLYNIAQSGLILILVVVYHLWLCRSSKDKNSLTKSADCVGTDETQPFKRSENSSPTVESDKLVNMSTLSI